jgi:NAD(P)-dependent dehydrogenase (short-subunit alcohol dehydrogenase family)
MSDLRFDGRVAIVTGAGAEAGLGRAYARLLASRGAKVVVNDLGVGPDGLDGEKAHVDRVVDQIRADGGEAIADTHSVATEDSAKAIIQTALDAYGRVDILVNNAGVCRPAEFRSVTSDDIMSQVSVHLLGSIWMCRAAWPHMIEQGYGRIVNTSSAAAWGHRHFTIYGAAKAGIFGLTQGLAVEGAAYGIRANTLAPWAVTTAFHYFHEPQASRDDRPPEAVASVVVYLCHEECELTAQYVGAGGGFVHTMVLASTAGFDGGLAISVEDVRDNVSVIADESHFTAQADPLVNDAETTALALKPQYQPK